VTPGCLLIFFIFFRGKGDEENKKNRAGSQQVVLSVGWYPLAAYAVSYRWPLFPSRHTAVAFLACVRFSGALSSTVTLVAAVRLALARSLRLGASSASPSAVGASVVCPPQSISSPPIFGAWKKTRML
jgi:hypothetical protein